MMGMSCAHTKVKAPNQSVGYLKLSEDQEEEEEEEEERGGAGTCCNRCIQDLRARIRDPSESEKSFFSFRNIFFIFLKKKI